MGKEKKLCIECFEGGASGNFCRICGMPLAGTWQDQPTEDGEYWLRIKNVKDTIVCVYNMGRGEHEESVCYFGSDMDESVCSITGKWYGPIMPPKED